MLRRALLVVVLLIILLLVGAIVADNVPPRPLMTTHQIDIR